MNLPSRAGTTLSRAPIVMSLLALALVIATAAGATGHYPSRDEGWQAHLFQILMVLQLPVILLNVVAGKRTVPILATQSLLWIVALASVALVD